MVLLFSLGLWVPSFLEVSPQDPRTRKAAAVALVSGLVAGVVLMMDVANPFPSATFTQVAPDGSGSPVDGRLIRATDAGVWLLNGNGRPSFYSGPLDTLVICSWSDPKSEPDPAACN